MPRLVFLWSLFIPALAFASGATECRSPDGKYLVWVKDTPNEMVSTGCGGTPATELWIQEMPNGRPRLLIRGHEDSKIEKTVAGIHDPCFSSDQKRIYFLSAAWATSDSVQCIDLSSGKVRFVIDGFSVEEIVQGKFKGKLLVVRALIKFDKNGESLGRDDYLWLVKADGTPIREIGRLDDKSVAEFRGSLKK